METRTRSLVVIIAAITVCGVGWGLSFPLYALIMKSMGAPDTLIGLNAAMPALATLAATPVLPALMRRFGIQNLLFACLAAILILFLCIPFVGSIWLFFPLRFCLGLAIVGMFVATEVWINLVAEDHNRGRIMGLYATCLAGGFALGALLLSQLGSAGWPPIIAGSGIFLLAMGVLTLARAHSPVLERESATPLLRYLRLAPSIMAAGAVFGAIEMGVFTLLPVYGLNGGLAEASATGLVVAVAAGNVAFQLPLGFLADRIDKQKVLALCAATGVAGALAVPFLIHLPVLLYAVLFVMGGVIVGLYTIGLVRIGERFRGADVAGANAAFVMMYGWGSLVAPPAAGAAMDLWRPHGLMVVLGLLSASYLLVYALRHRLRMDDPALPENT